MIEEGLVNAPDVYFEGGDHATLVHVSGEEFRRLMKRSRAAQFSHPA